MKKRTPLKTFKLKDQMSMKKRNRKCSHLNIHSKSEETVLQIIPKQFIVTRVLQIRILVISIEMLSPTTLTYHYKAMILCKTLLPTTHLILRHLRKTSNQHLLKIKGKKDQINLFHLTLKWDFRFKQMKNHYHSKLQLKSLTCKLLLLDN